MRAKEGGRREKEGGRREGRNLGNKDFQFQYVFSLPHVVYQPHSTIPGKMEAAAAI